MSLGVVPQALALYEELTALENLRFFGRIYGLGGRKLKERIYNCLDIAGLAQRSKDRVSKYSGGMKRRLNMVCSFLHDPPILLLDEPTVGVDPQSRNLIFDTIEDMSKKGRMIIYTTHYMDEAQRLCDKVAIIDHGRILDMDSVENLITKHGGPSHIEAEFEEKQFDVDKIKPFIEDKNMQLDGMKMCVFIMCILSIGAKVIFKTPIENLLLFIPAAACTLLCFVGIMMFICTLGCTEQSAGGAIIMIMAMVGGDMVPLAFMPSWLRPFSHISPVKWSIFALEGAIWRDFSTTEMINPCLVLLAIGFTAFLLGVVMLRRQDG